MVWTNGGEESTRLRSKSLRVAPRDELLTALRDTLGPDAVRLHRDPTPVVTIQRDEPWRRRGSGGGGGE